MLKCKEIKKAYFTIRVKTRKSAQRRGKYAVKDLNFAATLFHDSRRANFFTRTKFCSFKTFMYSTICHSFRGYFVVITI